MYFPHADLRLQARYVFIPPGVARFLQETEQFSWLPSTAATMAGVLLQKGDKTIFRTCHFGGGSLQS